MIFSRTELNRRIGNLLDKLGYELRRKGRLHADAFADQKTLLQGRQVRVIFDVGANVGQTSTHYRELFPKATIHSFEPFEEAFRSLTQNCRNDPGIKTHQFAAADVTGTRTFFHNQSPVTNSLLRPAAGSAEYLPDNLIGNVGSCEVPTTTLDDFCAAERIEHIDILKMDIQGGELMALHGAPRMLGHTDLIYTEVIFAKIYEGQAGFCDLCQYLDRHGYTLYGLYTLTSGSNGILAWGDAIFISQALRKTRNQG